jgi:hypothetical protein
LGGNGCAAGRGGGQVHSRHLGGGTRRTYGEIGPKEQGTQREDISTLWLAWLGGWWDHSQVEKDGKGMSLGRGIWDGLCATRACIQVVMCSWPPDRMLGITE